MVSNDVGISVGDHRFLEVGVLLLGLLSKCLPLFFVLLSLLLQLLLFHYPVQTLRVLVCQSLIEGLIVDFIKDGLQGIQTLLEYFVPMLFCEMHYHRHKERESHLPVSLQDG